MQPSPKLLVRTWRTLHLNRPLVDSRTCDGPATLSKLCDFPGLLYLLSLQPASLRELWPQRPVWTQKTTAVTTEQGHGENTIRRLPTPTRTPQHTGHPSLLLPLEGSPRVLLSSQTLPCPLQCYPGWAGVSNPKRGPPATARALEGMGALNPAERLNPRAAAWCTEGLGVQSCPETQHLLLVTPCHVS